LDEIPLSLIDENPYNSRLSYDEEEIRNLASSLEAQGLLTPVMVRRVESRFQLVYGHRRVRAAKLLSFERIKAEVWSFSDSQMLELSLIENLQRKDLSDYEKALSFARMNSEFGLSYSEIARLVGYSKQHICNHIRMAELFDSEFLSRNSSVPSDLHKISEHHARILLQIEDQKTRANTLRLVVAEQLSVRDLQRIVQRLRAWFAPGSPEPDTRAEVATAEFENHKMSQKDVDRQQIKKVLMGEFELPHKGNFEAFEKGHAFDKEFSLYTSLPPSRKYSRGAARARERHWFDHVAPQQIAIVRDLSIQVMGNSALATLYLDFYNKSTKRKEWTDRGTVVFIFTDDVWKIIHEHWSQFSEKQKDLQVPEMHLSASSILGDFSTQALELTRDRP